MDQKTPEEEKQARKDAVRGILFIGGAVLVAYLLTKYIGIEGLKDTAASAGVWGYLLVIVVKITTIIVVPLGGGPVYVVAGAVFGFWKGLLLTLIGDFIGFTAAFWLSRRFGHSIIRFFIPADQMPMLQKIFERGSAFGSFVKARIAFAAIPEVFAYAAGLMNVSYLRFIAVQLVPHVPFAALLIIFGDALLSGNTTYFIIMTVVALLFGGVGAWWFHRDIIRGA